MKLSTETLIEQVQSVVLETDELELQNYSHALAGFGVLSLFPLREIKLEVSHFETIQNLQLPDWRPDVEMQPVAVEKLVLIQRSIIHKQNFWQFRPINFSRKG